MGKSVSEEKHVFVVGPPRSGTTLVKNVLESHSNICGFVGETRFFLRRNYAGFELSRAEDKRRLPRKEIQNLVRESNSVTEFFDAIANKVKESQEADIFLEKTPEHALYIDFLTKHFPKSKIVFVVRDPRDGLRSAKSTPVVWSTFSDKDRVVSFIEVWRRSVAEYMKHKNEVLLVRYEDFCQAPSKQLSMINEFIGVDCEKQQLRPASYGNSEVSKGPSHQRLEQKITTKTVGSYKEELDECDIRKVEKRARDEMKKLHYKIN